MKKTLFAVLLAIVIPAAASATTPLWNGTMGTWTKLGASVHDFTGSNPVTTYQNLATNVCESCHAPHEAPGAAYGPLWNHALNTGANAYTMYGTTIAGNGPVTAGAPGTASLRCLACHDGTLNIDQYGGKSGTVNITAEYYNDKSNVTTDLTDDHPVGYDIPTGGAGTGWQTDPTAGDATVYGGNVECASCHDPHGVATYGNRFLRAANFCTDCHDK